MSPLLLGAGAGAAGLLLAFANGANDNLKGVATLYGSGAAAYRGALVWATIATAAGGIAALFLASRLAQAFTGSGLVGEAVAGTPLFVAAAAAGTAATVGLATRFALPVSTTHALTGALVGAGLAATGGALELGVLAAGFLLPLALSPFLAVALTVILYHALHGARVGLGISSDLCVCVGEQVVHVFPAGATHAAAASAGALTARAGRQAYCVERYRGRMVGLSVHGAVTAMHYVSAGLVSFARGLNDTPKIAALLLAGGALAPSLGTMVVVVTMALGGWLAARPVTETMARRVTSMNEGQGLAANLVTSLLVITASPLGFPVSTTHVSCGSIFGVGLVRRSADLRVIGQILLAWLVTLPLGLALGAATYWAGARLWG